MALPINILQRGSRASQPAATAVADGTLYCVTDENYVLEQSSGGSWVDYSPTGGSGTVTNTGTLTSGKTIVGNGSADVTVSSLTATVVNSSSGTLGSASTTGSGNVVLATSPTLVTPALGTPSSGTLSSCSGLPAATGLTGVVPGTQGGGLVLLESQTASASSALNFTAWYSSTYDEYVVEFVSIIPATNAVTLRMRFSTNGGASYDSSSLYAYSTYGSSSGGSGFGGVAVGAPTSSLSVISADTLSNSTTYPGVNATMRIFNPASSSSYKPVLSSGFGYASGTYVFVSMVAGVYQNTTAVNAFTVFASSGNLASGTIRVYGVAK